MRLTRECCARIPVRGSFFLQCDTFCVFCVCSLSICSVPFSLPPPSHFFKRIAMHLTLVLCPSSPCFVPLAPRPPVVPLFTPGTTRSTQKVDIPTSSFPPTVCSALWGALLKLLLRTKKAAPTDPQATENGLYKMAPPLRDFWVTEFLNTVGFGNEEPPTDTRSKLIDMVTLLGPPAPGKLHPWEGIMIVLVSGARPASTRAWTDKILVLRRRTTTRFLRTNRTDPRYFASFTI